MKQTKLRVIVLALCAALALAACGDPKPTEASPTTAPTAVPTAAPTTAPTEEPTAAPTAAPTVVPTEQPTETPTETPTEAPTTPEVTFEDVDETVYAIANLRIRSGPGTEYEQIGLLEKDEAAQRTGIGSNGWSRILYQGEVAYVHGDYVTTELPVTFEEVDETVYATTAVNVRSGPGTEYDRIGLLATDDSVKRTGIGSNGWSRVIYNGEIGYVSGEFLTTEAPAAGNDLLVGTWQGVYRMDMGDGHAFLVVREIEFNTDGTGYLVAYEYHYMTLADYAEEEGWFQGGMGYQGQAFTYELQGNELYFHFLGYETDYGDYMEPSTKMYEVYQLDDTWLVMSDLDFGSYLRGEDISIEELCEALDVDCSPPENTQ